MNHPKSMFQLSGIRCSMPSGLGFWALSLRIYGFRGSGFSGSGHRVALEVLSYMSISISISIYIYIYMCVCVL